MKQNILFLIAIFMSVTLNSQNSNKNSKIDANSHPELASQEKRGFTDSENPLKLDSTIAIKWDPNINEWYYTLKYTYQYDFENNTTEEIQYRWSDNHWAPYEKLIKITDGYFDYMVLDYDVWSPIKNLWLDYYKYQYIFDEKNRPTYWVESRIDDSNAQWMYTRKYEREWDKWGNEILRAFYDWDKDKNQWRGSDVKYEFVFDEFGNKIGVSYYSFDWDLMSWVGDYKTSWTQDINGNETIETNWSWDSVLNDWIFKTKMVSKYELQGNQTSKQIFIWDVDAQSWVNKSKIEFEYDANGYVILESAFNWDSEKSIWVNDYKQEFLNQTGENGKNVISIKDIWEVETNSWVHLYKNEMDKDLLNNTTKSLISVWLSDSETWQESSKSEYVYSQNNIMLENNYTKVIDSDQWVGGFQYTYEYDEQGNRVAQVFYNWDLTSNLWVSINKEEKKYDLSNRLIMSLSYRIWDTNTGTGIGSSGYEFKYDDQGNKVQYITYFGWDYPNNTWLEVKKEDWIYDIYNNLTEYLYSMWDAGTKLWVYTGKVNYFYSVPEASPNSSEELSDEIEFYPNPASNLVTFNIKDKSKPVYIELYDLMGRKVFSKNLSDTYQLNVSFLKNGVYTYVVTQNEELKRGKIIIE